MGIAIDNAALLGKVERGSESVQWEKLFQVLNGLGIRVIVDVPESTERGGWTLELHSRREFDYYQKHRSPMLRQNIIR